MPCAQSEFRSSWPEWQVRWVNNHVQQPMTWHKEGTNQRPFPVFAEQQVQGAQYHPAYNLDEKAVGDWIAYKIETEQCRPPGNNFDRFNPTEQHHRPEQVRELGGENKESQRAPGRQPLSSKGKTIVA